MKHLSSYEHQGVKFYDISGVLEHEFNKSIAQLHAMINFDYDLILGLESRGFIIGAGLSVMTNKGLVMCRKPGKLPGEVIEVNYEKEYGKDTLCVQKDALNGKRILIADDILATGGSLRAAIELVEKAGGQVAGFAGLLGLKEFQKNWPETKICLLKRV